MGVDNFVGFSSNRMSFCLQRAQARVSRNAAKNLNFLDG
jgi:hypothetical protein